MTYYELNRVKLLEKQKEYYKRNREKIRKYQLEYFKNKKIKHFHYSSYPRLTFSSGYLRRS